MSPTRDTTRGLFVGLTKGKEVHLCWPCWFVHFRLNIKSLLQITELGTTSSKWLKLNQLSEKLSNWRIEWIHLYLPPSGLLFVWPTWLRRHVSLPSISLLCGRFNESSSQSLRNVELLWPHYLLHICMSLVGRWSEEAGLSLTPPSPSV